MAGQSRILIVDDDSGDLSEIERALGGLDAEIVTLRNPHEVVKTVETTRPDVVILDALLPGLSGFDLCKEIKSSPELSETRILIVTAVYLRPHYRREAVHQFKADAFLTKPVSSEELERSVGRLLSRREASPRPGLLGRLRTGSSQGNARRGLFGRLFGTEEDAVETTRIAPLPEGPQASAGSESAAGAEGEPSQSNEEDDASREAEDRDAGTVEPPEAPEEATAIRETGIASEEPAPTLEIPSLAEGGQAAELETDTLAPPLEQEDSMEWEIVEAPGAAVAPEPAGQGDPSQNEWRTLPDIDLPASLRAAADATPADVEAEREAEADVSAALDLDLPPLDTEPEPEFEVVAEPSAEASLPGLDEPEPEPEAEAEPEPPTERRRALPRRRAGQVPFYEGDELMTELARELSKCKRVDRPLTVILVHVEDMEQIVELFGKEFREEVLLHVAEQAMASLRDVDLVGLLMERERIALTAFASDRDGGARILARLQQTVETHPIRVGEELPAIVPALVFGMASYPENGDDVESLLARAEDDIAVTSPPKPD